MSTHDAPTHPLDAWRAGAPCPDWCDHPGAPRQHLYAFPDPERDDFEDDGYRRTHRRHLPSALPADLSVSVTLEQSETTASPDQPATHVSATAWLAAEHQGELLTSTTARQLAALLLDAADLLDAINATETSR